MNDANLLRKLKTHRSDVDVFVETVRKTDSGRKIMLASQQLGNCVRAIDDCIIALDHKDSPQAKDLNAAVRDILRSLQNLLGQLADRCE
jgi:hypothetical protein